MPDDLYQTKLLFTKAMRYNKLYTDALDQDKEGNWDVAHELIQDLESAEAAWIHAYLHRKEGDRWNAGYWYSRAGKLYYEGDLEKEWQELYDLFSR